MANPFDKFENLIMSKKPKEEKESSSIKDKFKSMIPSFSKDAIKERAQFSMTGEYKSIVAAVGIAVGVALVMNEVPNHPVIVLGIALESIGFCYLFR